MLSLAIAVTISLLNLALAANVYLSLRGWLVPLEPSGMQLLLHLILTAPVVIGTTIWLFLLSKSGRCSAAFWKVNALGMLIPVISLQTGVTYHGYDKMGLLVTVVIAGALLVLFTGAVWRRASS